jgi:hypothetical protein
MACFHALSSGLRLGLPLPSLYTPLMESFASFTTYRYETSLEPDPGLPKTVDGGSRGPDVCTDVVKTLVGESFHGVLSFSSPAAAPVVEKLISVHQLKAPIDGYKSICFTATAPPTRQYSARTTRL